MMAPNSAYFVNARTHPSRPCFITEISVSLKLSTDQQKSGNNFWGNLLIRSAATAEYHAMSLDNGERRGRVLAPLDQAPTEPLPAERTEAVRMAALKLSCDLRWLEAELVHGSEANRGKIEEM